MNEQMRIENDKDIFTITVLYDYLLLKKHLHYLNLTFILIII